jgi:hypothetical protein
LAFSFFDFILLCIQLPIALWLIKYFSKKVDENIRPYFIRGLTFKIYACIILGVIYIFVYYGGDTTNYFIHSRFLTSAIIQSPQNTFKYLFASEDDFYRYFSYYIDQAYNSEQYFRTANTTVIKFAAVCNLLSFSSFFGTGFIFCFFSYWGQWSIFKVFYRAYPDIGAKFAYSLYIPSVVFWSSGILKDSICIGCIGLIVYIADTVTFKSKRDIAKLVLFMCCCYLVLIIKAYILFCLIIPLILWRITLNLKKSGGKLFTNMYFWLCSIFGVIGFEVAKARDMFGDLSLESIYIEIIRIRTAFEGTDSESSSFTLGDFSPSISGYLSQIPKAINAVLFRPYIWESKKVFSLVAAGESFTFFIAAIYIIYKTGFKRIGKILVVNPDVLFCFLFTIFFATALGLTVTNFGALVRFKIQFLPFLVICLILLYYKKENRTSDMIE